MQDVTSDDRPINVRRVELLAKSVIALAKRHLTAMQNDEFWPGRQEWTDLVGTSQAIFIEKACEEIGVPVSLFWDVTRRCEIDWDTGVCTYVDDGRTP